MPNPQIADYVKKELKKGVSVASIKASLLSVGWSSYDIDEAISSAAPGSKLPKPGKIPAPSASYGGIGFFDSIKKGFQIFFFKEGAAEEVAFSDTTKNAILIVAIYGVILALVYAFLMSLFVSMLGPALGPGAAAMTAGFSILFLILFPIVTLAGAFIGTGIFHLFAKLFGGQAKYVEYFRAMAHLYVVSWVSIFLFVIPFLGIFLMFLIGIWMIVAQIKILKHVHKLSTGRAILAFLMPILLIILILIILFALIFSSMMAQYSMVNAPAPLTPV